MIKTLLGWIQTAISYVHLALEGPPKVGATPSATLTNIIMAQAANFGPSPKTGGHLHAVVIGQATTMTNSIMHWAPIYGLKPAFVVAGLSGESRCDNFAINPNFQDAKPNETPFEQFMHTDIGAGQFDGSTLWEADGIFADLKGMTYQQMMAKAYEIDWTIQHFCAFVSKLIADTTAEVHANPKLLDNVRNGSLDTFAMEAYNAGETGAYKIDIAGGDMSYGERWIANFHTYDALMNAATT
jgi:hypothetical protein